MSRRKTSDCTIRRLPKYYRRLDELKKQGFERISSARMGEIMGYTSSQIRQDYACFGAFGQQGYGYKISEMFSNLGSIMGMDRAYSAIIIGAGNIGRALVCNYDFRDFGIELKAVFDTDTDLIGKPLGTLTVSDAAYLPRFLDENDITIAVLCVPATKATEMARILSEHRVAGIWNFTNADISSFENNSVIENIFFSDSLLNLSYHLAEKARRTTGQ